MDREAWRAVIQGVAKSWTRLSDWAEYSIVWIYHFLFIHSSTDGHLDCFYILAIVNSATMSVCVYVFMQIPVFNSVRLVELLDHIIILCLTFGGTATLFSTVTELFYIPTSNVGAQVRFYPSGSHILKWQRGPPRYNGPFSMYTDLTLYMWRYRFCTHMWTGKGEKVESLVDKLKDGSESNGLLSPSVLPCYS